MDRARAIPITGRASCRNTGVDLLVGHTRDEHRLFTALDEVTDEQVATGGLRAGAVPGGRTHPALPSGSSRTGCSRFDGAKQGLAVWLWAIVIAIVVAAIGGSQFNILATLNGLPHLPIGEGALTAGGIIIALVALAASLTGAILGGLAGMRFHRKVDRVGYDR